MKTQPHPLAIFRHAFLAAALFAGTALAEDAPPSLAAAYEGQFLVGTAVNHRHLADENSDASRLIARHFNTITAENAMKWGSLQPEPGRFRFETADRFVDFGERHGMFVIGHTLVWHEQTPRWVFEDAEGRPLERDALLERMREHIHTVVGRYKGRVGGWDVVNEALEGDGSLRDSPWRRIIGDDYLEHAFRFAHEADPEAELYYNDYSIENAPKRAGVVRIVRRLQEAGLPITAVGIQQHANLDWPSRRQIEDSITAFGELGVKVMITELDIDVLPGRQSFGNADISRRGMADPALNPYAEGLPDDVQARLTARYRELFQIYRAHRETVTRVTLWGVNDGESWLNHWPVRGRTSHPLLFDRANQPKPAFHAVLEVAAE